MNKAAFFDRDGTINVDIGYLHDIDKLQFVTGIPERMKQLQDQGYLIIVITNQSGIARGYYSENDMHNLHQHMNQRLMEEYGVHIDAFYFCPHHPSISGDCNCRKPKPGLFLQAIQEYRIDPAQSLSFGDSERDKIASELAGIKEYYSL